MKPSSTSSSDREFGHLPARGAPRGLFLALAILVAVELGLRRTDPVAMVPFVPSTSLQFTALRDLVAGNGTARVCFVGSSRTLNGIDAPEVSRVVREERGQALWAGNYGMEGAYFETTEAIVRHVLRHGRPELILCGISPRALAGGPIDLEHAAYFMTLGDWVREVERTGLPSRVLLPQIVRAALARRLLLVRYRQWFGLWVEQDVAGYEPHYSNPILGSMYKLHIREPEQTLVGSPQFDVLVDDVVGRARRVGLSDERFELLENVVRMCSEAGVPLVLFEAPVAPRLVQAYPAELQEEFLRRTTAIAVEHGVEFLTVEGLGLAIPDEHFRDHGHLNLLGARTLTRALTRAAVLPVLDRP